LKKIQVLKAISKVAKNPLIQAEGGLGKALGNKVSIDITGYCNIKLSKLILRVVYKVVRENEKMKHLKKNTFRVAVNDDNRFGQVDVMDLEILFEVFAANITL
jgi:hypothetical protein